MLMPEDRERVLAAHRRVFEGADSDGVGVAVSAPPHDDVSRWLNAWGGRYGVVAEEGERVVAAVSGVGVTASVQGVLQPWGMLTEIFGEDTDAGRAGLEECLREYARSQGGLEEGAAPVLLATVACPAVHHALRDVLGFEVLRDVLALEASVAKVLADADPGVEAVREELSKDQRMALLGKLRVGALSSREVTLERDVELERWRASRPVGSAGEVVARRSGEVVAWAALDEAEGALVVVDWLVAPEDHLALRALVRAAAGVAAERGASCLVATCADTQPEWPLLQAFGFLVRPARAFVLARTWKRPVDPTWLYERWSYTAADLILVRGLMDLVE